MTDSNFNQPQQKLEKDLDNTLKLPQQPIVQRIIPGWRFWVPLGVQLLLILAVPSQAVYTHLTGKTVILQTAPVDPYDFMRGYYQTLGYEISDLNTLKSISGWKETTKGEEILPTGTQIYVTLEEPKEPLKNNRPVAWKPVKITTEYPENLSNNQIALKGKSTGWTIEYGLERYYMPEEQREDINNTITEAQMNNRQSFVVEVKVNSQGKAVPVSLWVSDRRYRF